MTYLKNDWEDIPYLKVESISLTRMRNGEFYTFLRRLLDTMPMTDKEKQEDGGCSALFISPAFRRRMVKKLEQLKRLIRVSNAHAETELLKNIDRDRERALMLETSKADKRYHGHGTRIVRSIAEKYGLVNEYITDYSVLG